MPNEAGDMKLLGNFRKLIDHVTADPKYAPTNPALKVIALEAQYTAALAAVQSLADSLAPSKLAINDRQVAFDALGPLVMRSRNLLKASGVSKELLDDAETSVRKILGRKKTKTKAPAPVEPGAPPPEDNSHSASQMSFENQLGNFNAYISILDNVPTYVPAEADVKLPALKSTAADLQAKNNAVSAAFAALSNTRGGRDQVLYQTGDSVVDTALLAKTYVSGALGTSSLLYKQIKGLQFKRQKQ